MAAPNPKRQGSSTVHPQLGASFAEQESFISEGTPPNITGQLPQDHAGAHFNPDVWNSNPQQVSGAMNTQPVISPQELQASNNNNMAPNPKKAGSSAFLPELDANFVEQESFISQGTLPNITGQLPQDPVGAHFNPDVWNSIPQQVFGGVNTQATISPQEFQAFNSNNMVVPGWVPISANQQAALGNYYPRENQNFTANASTPKNPSPRPIPNALYLPLYGIVGMPVDPHLKALFEKQNRGEKWFIEPKDS